MNGSTRPIFVVGFQRSGTTLLQSLLGAHPGIAAPPELHYWFRVALPSAAWGDLRDDAVLRRAVDVALDPPVPMLETAGFDPDRVFARAAAGTRDHAGVLRAIMEDFAERQGARRWSEKSPGQPPGIAARWFPDSQLVHIVRDPRPTVASNVAAPWGEHNPWVLARRWRRFTGEALAVGARLGPDRYLRIRYEDLVADPDDVLREVFAFLGEVHDPAVLADPSRRLPSLAPVVAPHQRLTDPVAARKSHRQSAVQRARVSATTRALLEQLGYPRPSAPVTVLGHAANAALAPTAWRAARWWWRGRRARRDPRRLARVIEQFQQQA